MKFRGIVLLIVLSSVCTLPASASAEWQVSWYTMTEPGVFDLEHALAQTTFPLLISENWETSALLNPEQLFDSSSEANLSDRIGFQAFCEFVIDEAGTYRITLLANNGVALQIDGTVILHSWENVLPDGGGVRSLATEVPLEAGLHVFELWYYEWEGTALLHVDTNIEPSDPS